MSLIVLEPLSKAFSFSLMDSTAVSKAAERYSSVRHWRGLDGCLAKDRTSLGAVSGPDRRRPRDRRLDDASREGPIDGRFVSALLEHRYRPRLHQQ